MTKEPDELHGGDLHSLAAEGGKRPSEPPPTTGRAKRPRQRPTEYSHNACANCKARKVKCGEQRPTCRRCERNNIECVPCSPPARSSRKQGQGLSPKAEARRQARAERRRLLRQRARSELKFVVQKQEDYVHKRSHIAQVHTNTKPHAQPRRPAEPSPYLTLSPKQFHDLFYDALSEEEELAVDEERVALGFAPPQLDEHAIFFNWYLEHFCQLMTANDDAHSVFRNEIFDLVRVSACVYHAVQAMSAITSSTLDASEKSMTHQELAREHLQADLSDPEKSLSDATFCCIVLLCLCENWEEGTSCGETHLVALREIVFHRLRDETSMSRVTRSLINTFVFHDALTPMFSSHYVSAHVDDEFRELFMQWKDVDDENPLLMGYAKTLMPIIGQATTAARNAQSNDLGHLAQCAAMEHNLLEWKPHRPASPQTLYGKHAHCLTTAEVFRQATLLHLYTCVPALLSATRRVVIMNRISSNILSLIERIPAESGTTNFLMWPLLEAGSLVSARQSNERALVLDRITRLADWGKIAPWRRVEKLMYVVWKHKDEGHPRRWLDCVRELACGEPFLA